MLGCRVGSEAFGAQEPVKCQARDFPNMEKQSMAKIVEACFSSSSPWR